MAIAEALAIPFVFFRKVRDVSFFEDYFTVSGWRTNRHIDYNQIDAIERRAVGMLVLRTEVRISVKGDFKPLVLPVNPRNRALDTNLSSWLSDRIKTFNAVASNPVHEAAFPSAWSPISKPPKELGHGYHILALYIIGLMSFCLAFFLFPASSWGFFITGLIFPLTILLAPILVHRDANAVRIATGSKVVHVWFWTIMSFGSLVTPLVYLIFRRRLLKEQAEAQ